MMQYVETSRVRQLHARLLMSNVLFNAKKSTRMKSKPLKRLLRNRSVRESLKLRMADDEELVLWEKHRRGKALVAADLRRAEKRQQSIVDRQVAIEIKEEEKARKIVEMRQGLEDVLKSKKEDYVLSKDQQRALDKSNEKFNGMKAYIAKRKKEIEGSRADQVGQICQQVAAVNEELTRERDEKLQKFIEAMGQAPEKLDKIRRKAAADDIEAFRRQKLRENDNDMLRKKRDGEAERREGEELLAKSIEEEKTATLNIDTVHKNEVRNKVHERFEENKLLNRAVLDNLNADNERFHSYAMEAVCEFQQQGKNVTPILRGLRQNRPFPKVLYEEKDTFNRLGFTVRHVPAEAPEVSRLLKRGI
ncbi:hypothetical protein BC829DRAFT_393688 [Chytridium lagenaria]|nr:hypothetical protein BC829DRAFT_393688 [Chytridium lagenaria]